jgi:hypothetical protein
MKTQTNIRLVATVGAIGLVLSACGTSPVSQSQNQRADDYQQQARVAKQAISEAPEWMSRLPKESGVIYENGTAISSDFSMADLKAKTMAYVKICTSAGGKVRSQMKMYRADTDAASVEKSELTVRSLCPDVDISGVETVEMKHVSEGNRIRTYVLVALPLGSKNIARSTKDIQNNSGAAFKDLDGITREQLQGAPKEPVNGASKEVSKGATTSPGAIPTQAPAPDTALPPVSQTQATPESAITPIEIPTFKMNVKPATKMDGSMMDSVKAVGPDSVVVETADGVQKQLGLVESKNPEYVARRAQALNKPGAVIGQVSVE